uniref:Tetratricopeptide repeat domain 6 n=1 Tax=Lepisosteus oculatus TaxID=7918 RepID=W5MSU7_LEPOC|nr:PREDICTED: tetratricopeptide repeat protein 6 isoform X1 [Lepisosteus oculatus]
MPIQTYAERHNFRGRKHLTISNYCPKVLRFSMSRGIRLEKNNLSMAGNQRKLLSHSEELKLRKELESLHKQSQQDFLHFKQMISNSYRNMSFPTVLLDSSPDQSHTTNTETLRGLHSHQSTLENKSTIISGKLFGPDNIQVGILKSPIASPPKELKKESVQNHVAGSKEANHHVPVMSLQSCQKESKYTRNKSQNSAALKPAIAQQVGTTKIVLLSKRPEPPQKPKSVQPVTRGTRTRVRAPVTPAAGELGSATMKNQLHRNKRRGTSVTVPQVLSSDSSDESENNDDSHSEDSDESVRSESHRKHRGKAGKKRRKVGTESHPSARHQQPTSVDNGNSASRQSTVGSSHAHSVRSASELLEEAIDIARTDASVNEKYFQQRQPEGSTLTAKTLVRDSARTVDEIFASLQSGNNTDSLSASDQMIKELMERVLGHSYGSECEESVSKEDSTNESKLIKSEGPERSEAEDLKEDVDGRPVQTPDALKDDILHQNIPMKIIQKKDPAGVSPVTHISSDVSLAFKEGSSQIMSPEDFSFGQEDINISGIELPKQVTYSDILHVKGQRLSATGEQQTAIWKSEPMEHISFLATWTPKLQAKEYKTIHHLCTPPFSQVLPLGLQLASRAFHTPSKMPAGPWIFPQVAALSLFTDQAEKHRILSEEGRNSKVSEASPEDGVVCLPAQSPESLAEWQRIAEYYIDRPRMVLLGRQASMYTNESRMLWHLAPPKFTFAPSFVQDKLFPKYQETRNTVLSEELCCDLQDRIETDYSLLNVEHRASMENTLFRSCRSMVNLSSAEETSLPLLLDSGSKTVMKRSESAPNLSTGPETLLKVAADFKAVTKELEAVKRQFAQFKTVTPVETSTVHVLNETLSTQLVQADVPDPASGQVLVVQRKEKEDLSPSDAARKAGMKYIIYPRKKAKKETKKLSPEKLGFVQEKFNQPPRMLSRSESLPKLQMRTDRSLRAPEKIRHSRRPSLPLQLDFEEFAEDQGGIPRNIVPREWARSIWNTWFDEVFPPPEEHPGVDYFRPDLLGIKNPNDKSHADREVPVPEGVDLSSTLDEAVTTADLQVEVERLTQLISEKELSSAIHLCRRGALNKKLGHLNLALEDLNTAIRIEPHLLDAYWHRHSIHLLKTNLEKALDDLNFIIKHNKTHADAYKSKAEIYRKKGDSTLAIINYTQAIKCRPEDDENYFRRAEMYEKRNEILLAMEDYVKTFTINPRRTDALMIHGLHYFRTSNWVVALSDFTALLQQEPNNAQARTYRGRIYAKLCQYREAIEDLSAAAHLDPSNWVAFYYRGCLLRKIHPEMALRDLSVSVLINDSFENLGALLHRGILYTDYSQWAQAICDFEHVLRLDRFVPVAHVNLGLVYMLKMDHHYEAIRRFTNAIKVDPTYIRAYICRAQAYHKVHDIQRALKDLTHAIHLQPDAQHLYIMRGQYLCDMKEFELASFCIQYAAEMNKAIGSCPVQQAAVHSFLDNNTKAIDCLATTTKTRPTPPIFILLGKTQMKAKKYKDAVESFKKVLMLLCPNEDGLCTVPEAAEVFYFIGLCYMAQVNLLQALEAFSNAVKINPDYADAFYQRGLCRMRLQQSKSVQDFNRALSINPNLFQVYLSRAAFYGDKGRYSKAILNCNEAIKIQPKSVRAYLYRGVLKFYMKVYRYAVEDLTTAVSIDKMCSLAYYNRGVCYQEMKEYKNALRDYGIVQLLGSRREIDLKVLVNRGLLYVELNDYHNALQDFEAASKKSPEDATIFHALGVYHHRLGHLEEAAAAFTQAMTLSPFFLDACVGRGNVYMDYGHEAASKQAQRDFLTALHLNPLCTKARINLGYNFQVFGHFKKAWNQFTIASDIDPACWAAHEGRAVINLQMGHTYEAFQDINMALKHNPVSELLLTNRGVIHQFMGDNMNAMKDYQNAVSINPHYALAFFNAANMYFYNRQFKQASDYYTKAIDLEPSNESAFLNRAITRSLLRNVSGALKDFDEALKLNPFSAHVYFNRANLYISLKKYRSAEKDLSQALLLQPSDALVYKLRADVRGHLGLTELAIADYKTAVQLQEAAQHV